MPQSVAELQEEEKEIRRSLKRQQRDVDGITDEMVEQVMHLLQLLGVPYLVCPMEAEAQCAALEKLGLVDGIITDDSDTFAFGGRHVYRNIFNDQKHVDAFSAEDIEKELGFTQESMIALALLLGSDYTEGVNGVGIVNATEILQAFPGLDGLKEFRAWVDEFNPADELRNAHKKDQPQVTYDMDPKERFKITHRNIRRKWILGETFPNRNVVNAYLNPQVDQSDAAFSWALPDLNGLRSFCKSAFSWSQEKTDQLIVPVITKCSDRSVQTSLDQYFVRTYQDNVRYAKIQSKRLKRAVAENVEEKKKNVS